MEELEESVYIIKPEGMPNCDAIRNVITNAGLFIRDFFIMELPEWAVAELYPDLSNDKRNELWKLTRQHLVGHRCEIGIVAAENAVEKLVAVCGAETNPIRCGTQTIRSVFSHAPPVTLADGRMYWKNVIHRSKNLEEARRDMRITQTLSKQFGPLR